MIKESNVNLEEIVYLQFDEKDDNLKKVIKQDISKFKLTLVVEEEQLEQIKVFNNNNHTFILDCGKIFKFEFPEGSKNPTMEAKSPYYDHRVGMKMTFNYNDRKYEIHGCI